MDPNQSPQPESNRPPQLGSQPAPPTMPTPQLPHNPALLNPIPINGPLTAIDPEALLKSVPTKKSPSMFSHGRWAVVIFVLVIIALLVVTIHLLTVKKPVSTSQGNTITQNGQVVEPQ